MASIYCAAKDGREDKPAVRDSMQHGGKFVEGPRRESLYFSGSVAKSPHAIKNGTDFDFRKFKVCVIF